MTIGAEARAFSWDSYLGNTVRVPRTSPPVETTQTPTRGWAWVRLGALVATLATIFVVEQRRGWDDAALLRERVDAAGALGALVFVIGYAVLVLLPAPKAVLTALGGALYGLWLGALLSWAAAIIGAAAAFALGRLLGRQAVDHLIRGRAARADELLSEHGLGAVVAVRLVPVLPFTAINYAAGVSAVAWRHYLLGSAIGMIPGSLAYATLGAWGTNPWGVFAGVAALVALVLIGGLVGRRLLGRERAGPTQADDQPTAEETP